MDEYYYFNKVLRVVKELLEDPELEDKDKVRILGVIL